MTLGMPGYFFNKNLIDFNIDDNDDDDNIQEKKSTSQYITLCDVITSRTLHCAWRLRLRRVMIRRLSAQASDPHLLHT